MTLSETWPRFAVIDYDTTTAMRARAEPIGAHIVYGGMRVSATVSVDSYGPDEPHGQRTLEAPRADAIVVDDIRTDDIVVVDDVQIVDDIQIIDETSPVAEPATDVANPLVADDEVLDGFRDPVMPFVILGIISLITILVVAAMLAF